jgi:hypothetical protein
MGPEKVFKVLVVGDIIQKLIVPEKTTLLNCKEIRVKDCLIALGVASRHPSYFDFLFTNIIDKKTNGIDFVEQFKKMSPLTQIIYVIL